MYYNNQINWVQGIEGAKAYQLIPNSNIVLMDSENEGIFYIKTADNIGMCNLRTFKYEEVTHTKSADEYVTRNEMEEMIRSILNEQSIQSVE